MASQAIFWAEDVLSNPEKYGVAKVKKNPPMDMLGHVTSSYYSPNLKKSIALAVVKDGKNLNGKKLYVPMKNKIIEVTVSDAVFIDKEGKRLNA